MVTPEPSPSCVNSPEADTAVVPVALVQRTPTLRAARFAMPTSEIFREAKEGMVLLGFTVQVDGTPDTAGATVLEASHPSFIPMARTQLAGMRFWPACRDGIVVRTEVAQRFRYKRGESVQLLPPPLSVLPPSRGPWRIP